MTQHPVEQLEPKSLWQAFYRLTQIPRPSGHEEKVCKWLMDWAAEHNFEAKQDSVGNVYIDVPATPGHESAPRIILQGHVDIVGEQEADRNHDFVNEPLDIMIEGDKVTARGTTLGADNGIGVAAGLAAAEDDSVVHGPMTLLFTIDEERGLKGAASIKPEWLEATYLLNLDSEDEAVIFVGCAGGADTVLGLPLDKSDPKPQTAAARLSVSGLRGGHSGLEIHLGRGNAIKLLTRVLRELKAEAGLAVEKIEGGTRRNAIPRDAIATIQIPADKKDAAEQVAARMQSLFREELANKDPEVTVTLAWQESAGGKVWSEATLTKALDLLTALPHGVLGMSVDLPGVVETSTNLATVTEEDGKLQLGCSSRSSVGSILAELQETVGAIGRLSGCSLKVEDGYPGWKPNMESKLLEVARTTMAEVFGKPVEVTAIHAGLECGLLSERLPKVEMISFGPDIEGAHTPQEAVSVPSTKRFWDAFKALLERLA